MPKTRRYKKRRGGCPPYDYNQFDTFGQPCRPIVDERGMPISGMPMNGMQLGMPMNGMPMNGSSFRSRSGGRKTRGGCPPYNNNTYDCPTASSMQRNMGQGYGMTNGMDQGYQQQKPGLLDSIFGTTPRPNQNMAYNNGYGGKVKRRRTRKNRRSRK